EGCGDCGVQSNCVSILPLETEFGRKRAIDQSSCNKDYSCVKGFCPSFVTVHGGGLRKRQGATAEPDFDALPMPTVRSDLAQPWNLLITGVGGTGVVTIGALLGMAAHLEGKGVSVLDQTGLAQKGGAVTCHVRIAAKPADIFAVRIAAGEADVVLGCDVVVVNDYWALSKIRSDRTHAVINSYESMPGTFTRQPDMQFPLQKMLESIGLALGHKNLEVLDATDIATRLMGDSIATNLFMLGYAWQRGLVPVSFDALMRAIELNGAAVAMNKRAFQWGRLAAHDLGQVQAAVGLGDNTLEQSADHTDPADPMWLSRSVDELVARRVAFLTDYQDAAYAQRYRSLVDRVAEAERSATPGRKGLTEAAATYAYKVMAYKDEFEVARLYTTGDFERRIRDTFAGQEQLRFHLAPPLLARRDPVTGHLRKREFGPWILTAFRWLAKFRRYRGTWLDVFGRTAERRMERQLIEDYRASVEKLIAGLNQDNHELAVEIASIPEQIRGFGHVKEAHYQVARARWDELQAQWPTGSRAQQAA
ncbi:MAG: 2-oxoacid:acceptor oxidoreductase family protein, partial [Xanthomonadales bacterium]|nr:2-oxoacid:acceptor oxidoreductase family protein [Xanthomonadales bacterium]